MSAVGNEKSFDKWVEVTEPSNDWLETAGRRRLIWKLVGLAVFVGAVGALFLFL